MLVSLICATLLTTILLMVGFLLSLKSTTNSIKASPFECGFESFSGMRRPFSLRYFILLLLFLLFDVEVTLLFPCLTNLVTYSNMVMYLNLYAFICLLFIGLLYEWKNGLLHWV